MKKILFLAFALVVGVLACTSCKKDKNDPDEPELKGKVYHYRGTSATREFSYEHDLYIAMEDNHNMTMKWVGVKVSKDAEPVNLYLYNGRWEGSEEEGFYIGCEGTPQLPNGKPFDTWEEFDVSGGCDATSCSFDYHINGSTMGIFDGERVED